MSEDSLKPRFSAAMDRFKASTALKPEADTEVAKGFDKFRKRRAEEQDNTAVKVERITKADIENSPIFKILTDSSLDPKEQKEKIAELLFHDENDLDANPKAIEEHQKMVKYIVEVFSDLSEESLRLRKDNPLSELRGGTKQLLDEYHSLVTQRTGLKEKLMLIDQIIEKHGGTEGLIKALLSAKDKELEKQALDAGIIDARTKVDGLTGDLRSLDEQSYALQAKVAENEGDPFLFIKGDKKRQLTEDRRARADVEAKITMTKKDLTEATSTLDGKTAALNTFMTNEDYRVHEQILEVLDIGTDEFKGKLTELADTTLAYIDYSRETMDGVRAQLEQLLGRSTESDNAIQNTNDQVTILLDAQRLAQAHNGAKLQELKATEVVEGVEGMKREKKQRSLDRHIKDTERMIESTSYVAGHLGQTQVSSTLFKDEIAAGLADATKQQLLSTASATATGNMTIMRIESLATFVQGLIAEGAYKQETEYNLGELAKEMERGLMARMARNDSIKTIGDVLKEMSESMEERNDIVLQVAEEQHRLVDRLVKNSEQLNKANDTALAIESEVNRRLYGTPAGAPGGEPAAGAPSAPSLG